MGHLSNDDGHTQHGALHWTLSSPWSRLLILVSFKDCAAFTTVVEETPAGIRARRDVTIIPNH